MGEVLASNAKELSQQKWILIGHGDWESGIKTSNPLEPGVYMPLCQRDIDVFKPACVFLGHIHKPFDEGYLCYPGSPCGVDISETGKRRFLVFDTKTLRTEIHQVDTNVIYFVETISILPLVDEENYLRSRIKNIIQSWGITEIEKEKVRIRIKIRGYSSDIRQLKQIVQEEFKGFTYCDGEDVDLSDVFLSDNLDLEIIAREAANKIQEIWSSGVLSPTYDDILFHALKTIYGGK